jgi:hypothetical protein
MLKKILIIFYTVLIISIISGCVRVTGSYISDANSEERLLGITERKEFSYEGSYRNPIIVIHGFLGANLIDAKSGNIIWNKNLLKNPFSFSDMEIRALSFSMTKEKMFNSVLMAEKVSGSQYSHLVKILHAGGYQQEGGELDCGKNFYTLFQFSYDWRNDLQNNAVKFHQYLMKKKKYLQREYEKLYGIKNYDVQFNVIAYGIGGLIARYYLRFGTADLPELDEEIKVPWTGSRHLDKLIMLGTPNAGYLDSLIEIQRGCSFPSLPSAVLATWPSYYQLMPESSINSVVYETDYSKRVDLYDFKIWKQFKWGLMNPSQDNILKILLPDTAPGKRKGIAIEYLKKLLQRAKRFKNAMRIKAHPPEDVKLYLFAGNAFKTRSKAVVNKETGNLRVIEFDSGDGKVLRSSALFDERQGKRMWIPFFVSPIAWNGVINVRSAHMGIAATPCFEDNILYLLRYIPYNKGELRSD